VDQENEVLFLQIWLPIILSLCAFVCFSGPSHPSYRDFSKYSSLTLELAIVGRECDPKSLINIKFQPLQLAPNAQDFSWHKLGEDPLRGRQLRIRATIGADASYTVPTYF
jgi:hypothetical protein